MNFHKKISRLDGKVKKSLQECGISSGKLLVTAVSGGPDSLAMLFSLIHLRDKLGLQLHGAHLNHSLRGIHSNADAEFVNNTFRSMGINYTSESADVSAFKRERHLSLEEAAREIRYSFLTRVAREIKADAIILGHTSNDQAESVLMHILRGSGLAGLCGMQKSIPNPFSSDKILLARPLLEWSRKDTLEYCRALNLKPRLDETNLSEKITRNRIRKHLLPLMEEFNPSVYKSLIRLSQNATRQIKYLDSQVESIWQNVSRRNQIGISINTEEFKHLPLAIKSHLIRKAIYEVKGDLRQINQSHIDGIERMITGTSGHELHLPEQIRFSLEGTEATIGKYKEISCALPPLENGNFLNIPGETHIEGWKVSATLSENLGSGENTFRSSQANFSPVPTTQHAPDGFKAKFSYSTISSGLSLRTRKLGDRFQPLGMSGSKKIQDFMVDSKIPRRCRDRIPLIVSPRGIAWVAGWRIAEWAKVAANQQPVLELTLIPKKTCQD